MRPSDHLAACLQLNYPEDSRNLVKYYQVTIILTCEIIRTSLWFFGKSAVTGTRRIVTIYKEVELPDDPIVLISDESSF